MFFLLPLATRAAPEPLSPARAVQVAWERVHDMGAYRFTTKIVQTTYPAPALANAGRSPRQETFHLEGSTDLAVRTMQMSLWKGEGSVSNPGSGIEVRIEGEHGYGRQAGGQWQELDDLSGAFAPANDHMAYLVGAKNVSELGRRDPHPSASPQPTRPGREEPVHLFHSLRFRGEWPRVCPPYSRSVGAPAL